MLKEVFRMKGALALLDEARASYLATVEDTGRGRWGP